MKVNDDQLKAALDIASQALNKPNGDLTSADKTAFLTIAGALVWDIHRIADSLENLTAAVERLPFNRN